ncbi:PucR family transcriptional regulator [Cryptosporangium minutisporangium]|uniref:Helix-turn-helix domain-containing protein n=1 Tax=Cryptosporangium minutisporangium TaxID=113569 RepID=A0ABP6TAK7_9ACTN
MSQLALRPGAFEPWAGLPPELAEVIKPELGTLAEEIVDAVRERIPEFGQSMGEPYEYVIRVGVERALTQFADKVGDPSLTVDDWDAVHRKLGYGEFQQGRSLDALQAAYRLGARVAWRRLADAGLRLELPAPLLFQLGEAVIAYVDQLASLSVEGYAEAQAHAAGARERRRRQLMQMLLSDPPPSALAIADLAKSARWTVPERLVAVALEPRGDDRELTLPDLGPAVLVDLEGAEPCLLVPEAQLDRTEAALRTVLHGSRAALGLPVPVPDARRSLRWARRALALLRRGTLSGQHVVRSADHLSTLMLLADEPLVELFAERRLAPLRQLTVKQQARLSETLLAWLETRGGAPEVASRLQVHPQTVRYRLRQLEALFGEQLHDPDSRFELESALRALAVLRGPAATDGD